MLGTVLPPVEEISVQPNDINSFPQTPPASMTPSVVTTQEATLTFAAAPAAVNIVWNVLAATFTEVANWTWFPMVLSLIVGMAIYYLSPSPGTSRQKAIAFFFALVNSFTIAATALGIDTAVTRKTDSVQAATKIQSRVPLTAHVDPAAKQ